MSGHVAAGLRQDDSHLWWGPVSHLRAGWGPVKLLFAEFLCLAAAAAAAKSLQSCPTLFDPIDGSPPGFPVPGIFQARILEWVAIFLFNAWKWKVKVKSLSRVRLQRPHGLQPTRLLHPWDSPGKSTGDICIRIRYWSFYFWPASVCKIGSRFIHLIRTNSNVFLF